MDSNWLVTAAHIFSRPDNPGVYSFRFSVGDHRILRTFDNFAWGPGDIAMAHFVDPVPDGTWFPSLATSAPSRGAPALMFGASPDGNTVHQRYTVVYDPVASVNAAEARSAHPDFTALFPAGIEPMVVNAVGQFGDSGSGVFLAGGVLAGVNCCVQDYTTVNGTDNTFEATYEQPVWEHRQWILDTINGVGSSDDDNHDELKRRRLNDAGRELPMTLPPPANLCEPGEDPGAGGCSDPTWQLATLTPSVTTGRVAAVCPDVPTNNCSFNDSPWHTATPDRLNLGVSREVMVWCKTTDTLTNGGAPQPVLRVSFTNAEPDRPLIGYGWWDVSPDHVSTAQGLLIDTTQFATC